jgi:hypothetical protein
MSPAMRSGRRHRSENLAGGVVRVGRSPVILRHLFA